MTVHIKLDKNAMDALFPKGSEARVKLQDGVISQVANTLLVKQAEKVREKVQEELTRYNKVLIEEVNNDIADFSWRGEATLKPNVVREIKKVVNDTQNIDYNSVIKAQLVSKEEDITAYVDQELEYFLHRRLNEILRAKSGELSSLLEKRINSVLLQE